MLRRAGGPLVYPLGAWTPPLGVALRADGLSVVMLTIAAVVIAIIGVFARADFPTPAGSAEARAPFAFWILLLAIWAALNAVFLAADLFTLYVALELLTFAAVPLVCLDGRAETLQAALRYLLFALLGSVLYLAGTALLYGSYGTLDIVLLSQRVQAEPAIIVAAALMTVGLLAKTALFPLHLWLPPAHAGAPAAASAVLSALVVKGSFFIVVRLWFDVMPAVPGFAAAQLIAALGAAAIVFGSVVALRQQRLKLLIAYSTLAQIGYLFLMFPLAFSATSARLESGGALAGGLLQTISHASARKPESADHIRAVRNFNIRHSSSPPTSPARPPRPSHSAQRPDLPHRSCQARRARHTLRQTPPTNRRACSQNKARSPRRPHA